MSLQVQTGEAAARSQGQDEVAPESGRSAVLESDFLASLPCVIYECNEASEISFVSPNVFDLLGVRASRLVGCKDGWNKWMLGQDFQLLSDKLAELDRAGRASAIHRILGESGLPVWVCHSVCKARVGAIEIIRGCIVPIPGEKRVEAVDPAIISRFVHKLGNQFQLLNLVINSLRKGLPDSRETEILQQAVEKSIELARAFSDFSQASTWMSVIDLGEVLRAAYVTKRSAFAQKGVTLDERVDPSIGVTSIYGDPFLLELALSNIIQNALEATEPGGSVEVYAAVETRDSASVARLRVVDSGCGIADKALENVSTPFFTSKKDHEGLGLSMAARFVELHGGILEITSTEGKGTQVEIILPAIRPPETADF